MGSLDKGLTTQTWCLRFGRGDLLAGPCSLAVLRTAGPQERCLGLYRPAGGGHEKERGLSPRAIGWVFLWLFYVLLFKYVYIL